MAWWHKFTEIEPEPEYPRLGEPLCTPAKDPRYDWFDRWQGQIVDTGSTGSFIGNFLTETEALEESAHIILDYRTSRRIQRKSNKRRV